ncbi:MAG TPA: cell division protein FtsZ [Lutibacter sp.]|nr:cell division protein FtsZ [Lutibacter sp.]
MKDINMNEIAFEMPKNKSNAIKVIGVGGGGSNAVDYMFLQEINGVDFVICNTDAQALENSLIPNKIQLGLSLTDGMGAGANPEIGAKAAEESYDELINLLSTNTKMVFITAGMGGGTGTGAAPVIASIAKDLGLLTVGIVTMPFEFEGKSRSKQAQEGIKKLRENCDSLIVINNNKLRDVYGNLGYKSGFAKADEVLSTAAKGIAEVITHHYKQNIDLNDAKTVLSNSGTAIMGSETAIGEDRAKNAIKGALDSPLLNDNKITGARNVLLLIVSGTDEITIDEIGEINDHVRAEAGNDVNIIMGIGDDESIGDAISVTIIATGFSSGQQDEIAETEIKKIIHVLDENQKIQFDLYDSKEQTNSKEGPLADNSSDAVENKIIHTLEEENEVVSNLIPTTNFIKNIEILFDEIGIENEKTIQFDFLEEIEDLESIEDIVATTEHIKQTDVIFDEVSSKSNDDEFIIYSEEEIVKEEPKKQMELVFDFPIDEEDTFVEETTNIVLEQELDFIQEKQVISKEVTHNLSDYEEDELAEEKIVAEQTLFQDENLQFELITKEEKVEHKIEASIGSNKNKDDKITPLTASIADFKKTAEARKMHLKNSNYIFHKNPANIEEIEKEPAYKRLNIELEDNPSSGDNSQSRTSIDFDENDEIQLRTNNSFLHDNVD